MKIIVEKRQMDYYLNHEGEERPKYIAYIEGEKGFWDAGRSPSEAIGNLIQSHSEKFQIQLFIK